MAFGSDVWGDAIKRMNKSVLSRNNALEDQGGKRWEHEQRMQMSDLQDRDLMRRIMEAKFTEQTQPAAQPAAAPPAAIPAVAYGTGSAHQTGPGMTSGGVPARANDKRWTNDLRTLLTNPAAFQKTPGFKAALDTGRQAIERSFAARGMGGSGNVLHELMKFGTGLASQEYGGQVDRLSRLSQFEQGNPDYWKNTKWGMS